MSSLPVPRLLRAIYVHNPFYLISACLFVYGLQAVFRPGDVEFFFARHSVAYIDPWWLMLSLCGVTLLMAVTAYLIVRLGKVWEDARTLVLVLLLMFLAISVSFDEIVTLASWDSESAGTAIGLFVFGYCFSVGVCEALLRGLAIRLPWGYRGPFYGLLALFYAFPLAVSPEVADLTADQARWRIAAFPLLAALLTLSLLPAVRRGAGAVRENGTPWRWPWFPWTLFVFLTGAVCFRSFSLSISFDLASAQQSFWDSAFGPYLLVPFALSVLVVLLEIGLVEQLRNVQNAVLLTAPLLLLMAYPWVGPWSRQFTYQQFLYDVSDHVGSPVFLTLLGLLGLYAYAMLRGARRAEVGLVACLLLALVIEPGSFASRFHRPTFHNVPSWPLLAIGAIELAHALSRRRSLPALAGLLALSAAAIEPLTEAVLTSGALTGDSERTAVIQTVTMWHLTVLSLLAAGLVFRDEASRRIRQAATVAIAAGSVGATIAWRQHALAGLELLGYVVGSAVVASGCWLLVRERHFLIAAVLSLASGLCGAALLVVRLLRQLMIPAEFRPLLWAALCFLTGVLISALKGGLAVRLFPGRAVLGSSTEGPHSEDDLAEGT